MPEPIHTTAEVRVKRTSDIPNEPCAFCGSKVKATGMWLVFDEGGEPRDIVLHVNCARLIGALAERTSRADADA